MNKLETIDLKGKEYAQVATRLKKFREDCPNGLIETTPTVEKDFIIFKARVIKDKSNDKSAEATGHSLGKNTGDKAFEKLESIAVGRALAMLGYMASGEIASSEEMEEFYDYQEQKKAEAIRDAVESIETTKTLDELKSLFVSLGSLMAEQEIITAKDKRKAELSE